MLRKAITFLCGYLSLRGVFSSLLLEINKYGICSLFTGKYNFGVVPEWGICTLFLNTTVGFLYERTAPASGVIVCYPSVRLSFLFSPSPFPHLKSLLP